MAIVIRRLKENEIDLANDFFNSIYKTNRSREHFQWEFLKGPVLPAVYIIAEDDSKNNKVVGIQCAIPLHLENINGEAILTAKSEDTLVDPAYRGQRIFERMYDLLFAECEKLGIRFIWGFTPAKKAFERIGFEIPLLAHQALMVFNPAKAYGYLSSLNPKNKTVDKLKIAGLTMWSWARATMKSRRAGSALTVARVEMKGVQQALQTLLQDRTLYFLQMDGKYLQWRVADNPFNNRYERYQFSSDGTPVADVILNFRDEGLAYIEQIVFAANLPAEGRRQVIHHVIGIMKPRTSFIRVLCFDTNEAVRLQTQALEESGFIVLKRGAWFVWKPLGGATMKADRLFLTRLFTQGNQ